ncbi:universal stress protein [Streptomyces sp. CA-252508]|uniref:universal stress protein n=1 Tax=Streptomyces sp. CA-252508 TaxID=3418946 RepID=UPI003D8DC64C
MATGRIVVGVDGSEPSLEALRWAARQTELTGDALEAVIARDHPATGWPAAGPAARTARSFVGVEHVEGRRARRHREDQRDDRHRQDAVAGQAVEEADAEAEEEAEGRRPRLARKCAPDAEVAVPQGAEDHGAHHGEHDLPTGEGALAATDDDLGVEAVQHGAHREYGHAGPVYGTGRALPGAAVPAGQRDV